MNISMIYLCCFAIPLFLLVWLVEVDGIFDIKQILLLIFAALGNIGEFALSRSKTLTEALLAQKIAYVFGVFSPLIIFLMVCDLCGYKPKRYIALILYTAQIGFYLVICTIGINKLYYVSAELHRSNGVAYLTKEYGPLHSLYSIMMVLYLVASIVVASIFVNRNSDVNKTTVDIILCSNFVCIAGYASGRFLGVNTGMLPILQTLLILAVLVPFTRQKMYSITGNTQFVMDRSRKCGYVFFDKRLYYMGSNDLAKKVFPEFDDWDVDRKLPGSGGRFNTYLRQNLMKYVNEGLMDELSCSPFTIDGDTYRYTISRIVNKMGFFKGYMIEITHSHKCEFTTGQQEDIENV